MKRNVLFKSLIAVLSLLIVIIPAVFILPSKINPSAAIAPDSIYISPVKDGEVLSTGKAFVLSITLPSGYEASTTKWVSSDRNVISISSSGVLRTKNKGYADVSLHLLYKNGKYTGKAMKKMRLWVGVPVEKIKLSAESDSIVKGGQLSMLLKMSPRNATYKSVKWASSNPSVAVVSEKGIVYGINKGKTVISARAADGSGVSAGKTISVKTLPKDGVKQVAHRGLCSEAPENTVSAFEKAGQAGYWGVECDIRESAPDDTGSTDLILSHDSNFRRMTGDYRYVWEMTAAEAVSLKVVSGKSARSYGEHICRLSDYLKCCAEYDMVPVIELKGGKMTDSGYRRILWCLKSSGLSDKAVFISFKEENLRALMERFDWFHEEMKIPEEDRPGFWLLSNERVRPADAAMYSKNVGYDGIFFSSSVINKELGEFCKKIGIGMSVYTLKPSDRNIILQSADTYNLTMAITDYKFFE